MTAAIAVLGTGAMLGPGTPAAPPEGITLTAAAATRQGAEIGTGRAVGKDAGRSARVDSRTGAHPAEQSYATGAALVGVLVAATGGTLLMRRRRDGGNQV